jgi:hypothetical protein
MAQHAWVIARKCLVAWVCLQAQAYAHGLGFLYFYFLKGWTTCNPFLFFLKKKKEFTRDMSHAKADDMSPANPDSLLLKKSNFKSFQPQNTLITPLKHSKTNSSKLKILKKGPKIEIKPVLFYFFKQH